MQNDIKKEIKINIEKKVVQENVIEEKNKFKTSEETTGGGIGIFEIILSLTTAVALMVLGANFLSNGLNDMSVKAKHYTLVNKSQQLEAAIALLSVDNPDSLKEFKNLNKDDKVKFLVNTGYLKNQDDLSYQFKDINIGIINKKAIIYFYSSKISNVTDACIIDTHQSKLINKENFYELSKGMESCYKIKEDSYIHIL